MRRRTNRPRSHTVRAVLYGFTLFVCLLLQIGVLPHWRLLGVHPLWPPVLAVMIAVREGERYGFAFGLAAGLLCDLVLPRGGGFYTLFLMLACALVGILADRVLTRSFVIAALWCLIVFAGMDVLFFVLFYLIPGRAGLSALWTVALPETLFSVASALPLYVPIFGVSRLGGEERSVMPWKV